MEIVKPDEIAKHIADSLLSCPEDINDIVQDGWRKLKHTCNPRCLCRIGTGDGPENFSVKSSTQSKTHQTPPVTSSSNCHVIYPIPQKVFFNALAFILLHLTMAHGMNHILYPIFNQQGTWHPGTLYHECFMQHVSNHTHTLHGVKIYD